MRQFTLGGRHLSSVLIDQSLGNFSHYEEIISICINVGQKKIAVTKKTTTIDGNNKYQLS